MNLKNFIFLALLFMILVLCSIFVFEDFKEETPVTGQLPIAEKLPEKY